MAASYIMRLWQRAYLGLKVYDGRTGAQVVSRGEARQEKEVVVLYYG